MATTEIKIIVGLGNPGSKHESDRHNMGFWLVDRLAEKTGASFRSEKRFSGDVARVQIGQHDLRLLKPTTYMNLSGQSVQAAMAYHRIKPGQMLVVHDEIDLPVGTLRLKKGGGHGGHNGLRDIVRHCGADFVRLRLGVGHPGEKSKVTNYVLKRGAADVEAAIEQNIVDALDVMTMLIDDGLNAAQKELHTRDN